MAPGRVPLETGISPARLAELRCDSAGVIRELETLFDYFGLEVRPIPRRGPKPREPRTVSQTGRHWKVSRGKPQ